MGLIDGTLFILEESPEVYTILKRYKKIMLYTPLTLPLCLIGYETGHDSRNVW